MVKMYSRGEAEMNLGENLRYYRKLRGMTQDDIAKRLGTSRSLVGQFENGSLLPSLIRAREIAEILNITVDTLINEKR